MHEPPLLLEREVVDALPLLGRAEREQRQDLGLAAREQRGAVGARRHVDLTGDRADLLRAAAVGPPLLDGDLAPHEILVDRIDRLLDVLPREDVLHRRGSRLGFGGRRSDRERERDLVDDPCEEQVALRRLELLRVLLGIRERAQLAFELLAHGADDRVQASLLEQLREPPPDLRAPHDVRLRRVHRDGRAELLLELLDDRLALAEPLAVDALADPAALALLELGDGLGVEQLGLAGRAAQLLLRLADDPDLAVSELERREDRVLGNLVGPAFHHGDGVLRAHDEQVEPRLLEIRQRRVDDEPAVRVDSDPHRSHRAQERQRRDHQRRRRPVDREDVVGDDLIGGEDGGDDLDLVLVALRPERPDGTVDHPGGEDGALGRPALPLEETAGDLPGGVHPLLDVDGQREEIGAFPAFETSLRGGQHHCIAGPNDDGAVGLLGQMSGLELHLAATDGARHRVAPRNNDRHVPSSSSGRRQGGGLRQPRRSGPRGSLKLPPAPAGGG